MAPISCGKTAIEPGGRLVAHTPALPHHAQIRAQKSAQFSMVSTVYTRSMGTYWV
jgi:hypothetical protein